MLVFGGLTLHQQRYSTMAGILPPDIAHYCIEIPETLESKETYEFIGLTKEIASDIWKRYDTRDPAMPDSFLEFAQYHIEMHDLPDAYTRY